MTAAVRRPVLVLVAVVVAVRAAPPVLAEEPALPAAAAGAGTEDAPAAPGEDSDALFLRARSLSGKETREEARALCRRALARSPGYHDVRIYLGRLHAWDGQWDPGREALRAVLAKAPANGEAREALVDLEWWADRPIEALQEADAGLAVEPGRVGLLYRKARILRSEGDLEGALAAARAALVVDPDDQPSRLLRDDVKERLQRSKLSVDVTTDVFDRTFDPWWLVAVAATHRFDLGSVTLRVNRADRFAMPDSSGKVGHQVELDAYPRLRDGTYAYLSAGASGDDVFPPFRWGAELYQSVPGGWEVSGGVRQLLSGSVREIVAGGTDVTIWTASLSKYVGDWLFTLRPYVTPGAAGSSVSGGLTVRRYLDDADSYLGASVGAGVAPDQGSPTVEILGLRSVRPSVRGGLSAQKRFGRAFVLWGGAAVERQEIAWGNHRIHGTFNLGCEQRF
jgi:YaiO family outer membrane protein